MRTRATTASIDLRTIQRFTTLTLLVVGAYLLFNNPALAGSEFIGPQLPSGIIGQSDSGGGAAVGGDSPMGAVLCRVVGMVMGDVGRGLATLAVIVVGVGAMLGKVSWGMAMTVAVGIAVVFGAPTVVGQLGVMGGGCVGGDMIMAGGSYAGSGSYGGGSYGGGSAYNNGGECRGGVLTCGAASLETNVKKKIDEKITGMFR